MQLIWIILLIILSLVIIKLDLEAKIFLNHDHFRNVIQTILINN